MAALIGIFGGTFDPVHYGHLKPAAEVKERLGLDEIRFIPNHEPPHRKKPWLHVAQRKQLLELAMMNTPGFVLDLRELNRHGKSYTVDTLKSLRDDYPSAHLCLILGMDAMAGLRQWHQAQEILTLCHIVVLQRPGYRWQELMDYQWFEQFRSDDKADLKREDCGRILLQSISPVDISASEIRHLIKHGKDISHLVPAEVHQRLMTMIKNKNIEAVDDD